MLALSLSKIYAEEDASIISQYDHNIAIAKSIQTYQASNMATITTTKTKSVPYQAPNKAVLKLVAMAPKLQDRIGKQ